MAKKTQHNSLDFEQHLEKLTQLVEKMECGKLPLDESLQLFEQGVKLIRQCQDALQQAEQRVLILNEQQQLNTYEQESDE